MGNMTRVQPAFNFSPSVTTTPTRAPLKNMARLATLVEKVRARPDHMPRMAGFSGWSGYGKSFSAAFVSGQYRAYYVEARSYWTRKSMMEALAAEVGAGVSPRATVAGLVAAVARTLADTRRPLIIDEFDHLVERNLIDQVRDIYEESGHANIILIGEELLPHKLQASDRFHGRVGAWDQAQPCDLEDARALAGLYCRTVTLADDLLADMLHATRGSVRYLATNLDDVREFAEAEGADALTLANWGGRGWLAGATPAVRAR